MIWDLGFIEVNIGWLITFFLGVFVILGVVISVIIYIYLWICYCNYSLALN